MRLLYLKDI